MSLKGVTNPFETPSSLMRFFDSDHDDEEQKQHGQTVLPNVVVTRPVNHDFHSFSHQARFQQEAPLYMHRADRAIAEATLEGLTPFRASSVFSTVIAHVTFYPSGVMEKDFENYWIATKVNFEQRIRAEQRNIPKEKKRAFEAIISRVWEKIQLRKAKDGEILVMLTNTMKLSSALATHLQSSTYYGPTSAILGYASLVREVVYTVGPSLYDPVFALLLHCDGLLPSPLRSAFCDRFLLHAKEYLLFEAKEYKRNFFYHAVLSPMIKKNGLPNVPSEVTVEDFLCQMPGIGPRHEHTIQEYRKGLMEYLPALCLFIRELFAEEQRIRAICIFQSSEELVEALTMKGMTPHTIHAFLTNLCPEIVSAIHMKVVPPQIAAEWIAFFGEYDWSVNHEQEASFERMVKILHGLQKSGMATDEAIGIFVRCFSQFKVGQLENRTGVHYDPFERYESP